MSVIAAPSAARTGLALLAVANALKELDRHVFAVLLESIRHELHLPDALLGVLLGTGVGFAQTLASLPAAHLADRASPRRVLAASIALWSAATSLGGLATNAAQLFAVRLLVGLGSAGTGPALQARVAHLIVPSRRAAAFSAVTLGAPLGLAAGLALGGWLDERLGWRATLLVLGLPGLLLAAAIARHGGLDDTRRATPRAWTPPATRSLRRLLVAMAVLSLSIFGGLAWLPSFFIRVHGLDAAQAGLAAAIATGVGQAIGLVWTMQRRRIVRPDRDLATAAWLVMLQAPLQLVAFGTGSLPLAVSALLVQSICQGAAIGPVLTAIQHVADPSRRAASSALLFVVSAVGLAIGSAAVGALSDAWRPALAETALRAALLVAAAPALLGGALLLRAARHLPEDATG